MQFIVRNRIQVLSRMCMGRKHLTIPRVHTLVDPRSAMMRLGEGMLLGYPYGSPLSPIYTRTVSKRNRSNSIASLERGTIITCF